MTRYNYFCKQAFLNSDWAKDVCIEVAGGLITAITENSSSENCEILSGPTLPTIANLHSHAFQYLMAGMSEIGIDASDSFWGWRDIMYKLVARLSPDDIATIARQLYIQMLKAGFTQVGEFHYLHKDSLGKPYANTTETADQLILAAEQSGIGLTLLPVLYSYSNFGAVPPTNLQAPFINTTDNYLSLLAACETKLADARLHNFGICFHSLRAVDKNQIQRVLNATEPGLPIHIHIAEQKREVNDCLAYTGKRPVEWLTDEIGLSSNWCLIHATHVNSTELQAIAKNQTTIGLCPSTEANLGDGIFPATHFIAQNGHWGIGSDSHVTLSIPQELRSLEYSQRLRDQQRNRLYCGKHRSVADYLFHHAHSGGNRALGVNCGLAVGQRADFMVLDASHPFIGASKTIDILNRWVFACNGNVIKDVFVAGEPVIQNFQHSLQSESQNDFANLMKRIF